MSDMPLLEVIDATKSYYGVRALDGVSFDLKAGEVHAIIGENGAGKSTLIRIITGAVQPDGGEIRFNGKRVLENSPRFSKKLGIAAIYQQPALFPELSVSENIAIGLEEQGLWSRIDWRQRQRRARELLGRIGAMIDPETEAGQLSVPEQQLAEIARALGAHARVLIMDEPTASLTNEEAQSLFRVIVGLREQGTAIIYISHRLEELSSVADRVTVLRDGRVVETLPMAKANTSALIRLMVGRELSAVFPKTPAEPGEPVLELCDLGCSTTGVRSVNLQLRSGEILGIAGLVGAGRTALARIIFGLTPADEGSIEMGGKRVRITSPAQAIRCRIAYVPEDRRRHSVIPEMAISANITLASLDRLARRGGMDFRQERAMAREQIISLGIKTPAIYSPVSTLSGGNQQKVALGRWLCTNPSVLILDEPTQGIDVGAKAQVHSLMNRLTAQGLAILMISSDMPEILGMSDRIAVMANGTITGILDREEATQEKILALAIDASRLTPTTEPSPPQMGPAL
ncbi:MAG TPA: sugar ABC transporter ATP-binding protein [Blastocatellia bacterium]|nr:sugar ABC transporter ATP-binding protein [Blastocatellia bacterium]